MLKRKKGEQEAITILENLGIEIDRSYYDDNSQQSMPDIRCKDGRYIEITHTFHNNAIPKGISKFDQLQPGETWSGYTQRRMDVEIECSLHSPELFICCKNKQFDITTRIFLPFILCYFSQDIVCRKLNCRMITLKL